MKINPRLRKEARVLFWPWCAVVLTVTLWLLWHTQETQRFYDESLGTARLILGIGAALLAALSFGAEFQSRTLPLLLSQPCSRRRLWSEKMLVLAVFEILLLLGFVFLTMGLSTQSGLGRIGGGLDVLIFGFSSRGGLGRIGVALSNPVFYTFVPLVCSAGFWSLFARSMLGGVIFSLAALGAVMLAVVFVVGKAWEGQPAIVDGMTPIILSETGLAYALLFLRLGWRKFARLELNVADGSEGGWSFSTEKDAPIASVLRSRAGSPHANLVRKELRLLRPLLVLALLFAAAWLALTWLVMALPRQKDGAEMLLATVTGLYMALSLVLAGCLPLCEERTLGLHLSNLTLPVPVRLQWRLKLLVALAAGLLAGAVLPVVLSISTRASIKSPLAGLIQTGESVGIAIAAFGLVILLGFWSATMISRVSHGLLLEIFTMMALLLAFGLGRLGGNWAAFQVHFNGYDGKRPNAFLMDLVTWAAVRFQISIEAFYRFDRIFYDPLLFATGVIALVAGVQSWRAFRFPAYKANAWVRPLGWMALAVALTAGVATVAREGLQETGNYLEHSPLVVETRAAFSALFSTLKLPPAVEQQKTWPVSLAELEATGKLSAQTKVWLKNTKMEIVAVSKTMPGRNRDSPPVIRYHVWAKVVFPNGDTPQFFIRSEQAPP